MSNTTNNKSNSQMREVYLIQNNYKKYGLTVEKAKELVMKFKPDYWCMSEEIRTRKRNSTFKYLLSL